MGSVEKVPWNVAKWGKERGKNNKRTAIKGKRHRYNDIMKQS